MEPVLTVREAASALRTTPDAIYRRIRRGTLPVVRDGARVLVPEAAIVAILGGDRQVPSSTQRSSVGPRGLSEPRMHDEHRTTCTPTRESFFSIVPCTKGTAKFTVNFYLHTGGKKPHHVRRRSPHDGKPDTRRWAAQVLAELLREATTSTSAPQTTKGVTVRDACDRWLATQERDVRNKARHVSRLLDVWGGDTLIDALDHEAVISVPAKLAKPRGAKATERSARRRPTQSGRRRPKGCGLQAGTTRAICQTANRIISFAAEMGWRRPAKVPLPTVPIGDAEWFTLNELRAILDVSGRWRLAYLIGARCGLRRGELVELRWSDVQGAVLRVARAYKLDDSTRMWIVGPTKSKKPRTVKMPPDVVEALEEERAARRPSRDDLVLVTDREERVPPWVLSEMVLAHARAAGIDRHGIGCHTLRHTFCSHLAQGGARAGAIQRLAGHASLRTTERYMHLAPSDLDDAVSCLPPLSLSLQKPCRNSRSQRSTP